MTFFTTHPFCGRSIYSGADTLQICKHGTGAWLHHTVDCEPVPALCRGFVYFCRGHGAYYTVTKIWIWVYGLDVKTRISSGFGYMAWMLEPALILRFFS